MTKGATNPGSAVPLFKAQHFSLSQKPNRAWSPSTGDTGTEGTLEPESGMTFLSDLTLTLSLGTQESRTAFKDGRFRVKKTFILITMIPLTSCMTGRKVA